MATFALTIMFSGLNFQTSIFQTEIYGYTLRGPWEIVFSLKYISSLRNTVLEELQDCVCINNWYIK